MVRAVFLHVPKTAGTSFRDALCRGFGTEAVSPAFNASWLTPEEVRRLGNYDVICGHISIVDADRHFPGVPLLTILRDPVDRCLSWYYFARQLDVPHLDVQAARDHDVDQFFSLDPRITFRNIFNRQARQLGDHVLNDNVDFGEASRRARLTLDRCVWVGMQKSIDADMVLLGDVFPEMRGVKLQSLNVTARRPAERPTSTLAGKVEQYNAYDRALVDGWCRPS